MKELAGEINMYQAKVFNQIFRKTSLIMTLKGLRNRFRKLDANTTSRRRGSKLAKKIRRFCSRFDPFIYVTTDL
jgi:hypothetical protein